MNDRFQRSAESQTDGYAYRARLILAQQNIRDHPGAIAKHKWDTVNRSYDVYLRNVSELLLLLNHAETNQEMALELFKNVGPFDIAVEFYKVLDQRLHNMIAGAISVVDQTRVLLDGYEGSTFAKEYEAKSRALKTNPRTSFLRRLRNYLLHVGQPPIRTAIRVKNDNTDTRILLDSPQLLKDFDWTAPAREFIEANLDGIHLSVEVRGYAGEMADLYRWTFDQFEILHGNDIDRLSDLVSERNLIATNSQFKSKEEFDKHMQESSKRLWPDADG